MSWGSRLRVAVPVLMLTLGLGSLSACGNEEPAPVTKAKEFATAVRAGNVEDVLEMMDAAAAEHLREAAQRASDQVGGRRVVAPYEMLQIVDVDPSFQVAKAELTQGDDSTATVVLTGADGVTHDLHLVVEDGEWKVRIGALPPTTEES